MFMYTNRRPYLLDVYLLNTYLLDIYLQDIDSLGTRIIFHIGVLESNSIDEYYSILAMGIADKKLYSVAALKARKERELPF